MIRGPQVLALFSFFFLIAPLHAQTSSYVYGRVLDPSDAMVPGASVTVVNQDTGFRRVTQTAGDGVYTVTSLQSGLYKVTVRKEGFVGMVRFDLRVDSSSNSRADFKLAVGAVQETITVEGT